MVVVVAAAAVVIVALVVQEGPSKAAGRVPFINIHCNSMSHSTVKTDCDNDTSALCCTRIGYLYGSECTVPV